MLSVPKKLNTDGKTKISKDKPSKDCASSEFNCSTVHLYMY